MGPWRTLAWCAAAGGVFALAQALLGFVLLYARGVGASEAEIYAALDALPKDGLFLALGTLAAAPLSAAVLAAAIRLHGRAVGEYLALRKPRGVELGRWLLAAAGFAALCDLITWGLGRPVVTEFARQAYESARPKILVWAAFAIVAPLFEEAFFRGFLYRGLEGSRLGPVGAVWGSAVYFAVLHVQYDLWGMLQSLGMGLLFGWARMRTGTLAVPCAMHAANNAAATLEAAIL